MTQKELAEKLGVTAGRVSQYKAQGMPVESMEAAEAWLAHNVSRDKPRNIELPENTLPEDMGPLARLNRAQEGERRHFALWEAAIARKPANTREIAELATSWREMRKGASEAEKEYGNFLLQIGTTINKGEAIKAIRGLFTGIVQDLSTHPWGEEATRIMRHHLATLPANLRD